MSSNLRVIHTSITTHFSIPAGNLSLNFTTFYKLLGFLGVYQAHEMWKKWESRPNFGSIRLSDYWSFCKLLKRAIILK